MKLVQKIFAILLVGLFFFSVVLPAFAQEKKVTLHLFWANGCPHCAKEKQFLTSFTKDYPEVIIKLYELTSSSDNQKLFAAVGQVLKADTSGVPFTIIGKEYFTGWLDDETTGQEIVALVEQAKQDPNYQDVVVAVQEQVKKLNQPTPKPQTNSVRNKPIYIQIPIIGKTDIKTLSLPAVTIIIGLLDGFNPCAMWILLFLISLLLGVSDVKKRWLLGLTFLFTSATVYFLFLVAWLNIFLFIGLITWVRLLIGLVALGLGVWQLRSYYQSRKGGCAVIDEKKRKHFFSKIQAVIAQPSIYLAMGGIALVAVAVNLVELICSAGLPAIYTNLLAMANLPMWQYYSYLGLYMFFFMLDDLVVFTIAMLSLQAVGVESKYSRFTKLIGGMVILLIGIAMLFKPELLLFG